jgi:hypothetical protein
MGWVPTALSVALVAGLFIYWTWWKGAAVIGALLLLAMLAISYFQNSLLYIPGTSERMKLCQEFQSLPARIRKGTGTPQSTA